MTGNRRFMVVKKNKMVYTLKTGKRISMDKRRSIKEEQTKMNGQETKKRTRAQLEEEKRQADLQKVKDGQELQEKRQAELWKAEIEKGLQEVQNLREKLKPVEFPSWLWEQYTGAYGDVREDVAFLFCPEELIPKTMKLRRLDTEEKSDYEIIFDNLCENLMHQMSWYPGSYLAMPYLVLLLEKRRQKQDYRWEKKIIQAAGDVLSTDIPCCGGGDQAQMPEDIVESYQLSVELLQEMTKDFLDRNMERLKEENPGWLQYFCTDLMAILGDREAAFQMFNGQWEQCPVTCPECGYFDEDMEADGFYDREQLEKIEPAASVLGKWDGKSYEDTYLWFSNLAHELGVEDEWKIPYYYGTYTCPECGSRGILMDWMKDTEM